MKITQLRNATIVVEFKSDGRPTAVLIDPMLAPRHALPSLKWLTGSRRRNPLVELPANADEVLGRVSHGLITHCQRGHFDHLDRAGKRFLRERRIPVICMPRDENYLARRQIVTQPLCGAGRQPFFHGRITPIGCVHGAGIVGRLMEHGHGYFVELPGEPSLYIAGDTILSADVRRCLTDLKPDVSILPAGGARFDIGGEILMNAADICLALAMTPGVVIANHLEALDHCPTTRIEVAEAAARAGVGSRLAIPADGQTVEYRCKSASSLLSE
jgi:L-ascorbate metabolism protein UlaG (beta-lactamase superfamily)